MTAALTGLEIGFSHNCADSGGITLTVPTMLGVYAVEGLVEAALTSFVATGLMISLSFENTTLIVVKFLRGSESL